MFSMQSLLALQSSQFLKYSQIQIFSLNFLSPTVQPTKPFRIQHPKIRLHVHIISSFVVTYQNLVTYVRFITVKHFPQHAAFGSSCLTFLHKTIIQNRSKRMAKFYSSVHSAIFFPLWRCGPTRAMASSFLRFLDHTQRRTTFGRTLLDE